MKNFVTRRPLVFSLLITLVLFGLALVSIAALFREPVGNVAELAPEALEQPTDVQQAFSRLQSVDSLFWLLTIGLVGVLIAWLGWWREAGFNRPSRWQNLYLLLFPLLVGALGFSGGFRALGPAALASALLIVFAAVLGEEAIYRGVVWRALAPAGVVRAMVLTSLLSGALAFGRTAAAGPWPEALYITVLTICGGFTYAALRWRTASIWPVILVHFVLAAAIDVSSPRLFVFPIFLLAITLGFVGYGLLLLRNPRVRADGGL